MLIISFIFFGFTVSIKLLYVESISHMFLFKYDRKRHIAPYFYKDPNILKFAELMNIEDISIMTQTTILCKKTIITQFERLNK